MCWKEEYRSALLDKSQNPPNIRNIIEPNIPGLLYKYGSFKSEYWKDTVYKAKIHLSPANVFNDPFDCKPNFNYKEAIKEGWLREWLIKKYPDYNIEIPQELVQRCIIDLMRTDVYVFCFSEIWNSLLMWAHYGNSYDGYCLEYDTRLIKDYLKDNLYPVLYEEKYIDITENLKVMNRNTGLITNLAKANEWKYEREWRIVRYKEQPFYFRKPLKAVYLGKNCNANIKIDIKKWASEQGKKVYIVEPAETRYELIRKRIC